jgi:hypothetical protein
MLVMEAVMRVVTIALIAALLLLPAMALAQSGSGGIAGGGSATNASGTIASASTSQQVLAANSRRVGCEIQALGSTDLWVAIDGTASNGAGSWWLPGGSLYRCPATVPTGRISVWSATVGAAFTAQEFSR